MDQYAIAFDLDNVAMQNDGLSNSDITTIYRTVNSALRIAGFPAHPQQSLYHTVSDHDPITALMVLQTTLKREAPNFCRYVKDELRRFFAGLEITIKHIDIL